MAEEEHITLPREFIACPVCGSQKRIGERYLQQLRDEGVVHKDSFKGGLVTQVPLVDQAHPPVILGPQIKINVLLVYWDVCEQCGAMYCTKFDCIGAPAQVQMQPQKASPGAFMPHPPGFNFKGNSG